MRLSCHQLGKRPCEVSADDEVVDDPQLLEHGLEQHPFDVIGRAFVEGDRVGRQSEKLVDLLFDGRQRRQMPVDDVLCGERLTRQPLLLRLEVVNRERVVVVRLLGLRLTMLDGTKPLLLGCNLSVSSSGLDREHVHDLGADLSSPDVAQLVRRPLLGDRQFDTLDADVPLGATVRIELSAEAVEVGVLTAVAGREGYAHTPSTTAAVERALERVRSSLRLVARVPTAGQ